MMKRVFWTLTFLVCVCAAWSALRTSVHEFSEDKCGDCHASVPVKGDPQARVMKAPISMLCGRCHNRPVNSLSHPVEIEPVSVVIPADFPLSWDKKLTCSTCHDIHASSGPAMEGPPSYLRRPASGRAFCEACHHVGVAEQGKPSHHSQVLGSAHMEFDGKETGSVDKLSRRCLGCHDGTIGQNAEVRIGSFRHGVRPAGSAQELSHPIGINYRKAMMRDGGLHPPETLDHRIRLANGRVGCGSCHDMYSREPMLLTMANNGSHLCLECHDK